MRSQVTLGSNMYLAQATAWSQLSERTEVGCMLIGSGRGFLINAHDTREIGPKSGSASKHGRGLRRGQR